MELLSILRFLQPFFTASSPSSPAVSESQNLENASENQENTGEKSQQPPSASTPSQDAILGFYQAHELRARRIKK